MKLGALLIFFVFLQTTSYGQVHYDEIRSKLITYCGKVEDSIIWYNANFVDSVAKLKIESGLQHFLEDYGRVYYAKYLITKDRNDLIVSVNAHTRNWDQFGSTLALYNMVSSYAGFDCYMCLKYLTLLEDKIEKNELDFPENKDLYISQIAIIREVLCPE